MSDVRGPRSDTHHQYPALDLGRRTLDFGQKKIPDVVRWAISP